MKISSGRVIFIGAALLGCLNGTLFLYVEFQNNNQGEYVDTLTGAVDFPYAGQMFAVSAVPTFLAALVLGHVALLVVRALGR